jgi:hypothetical protein
VLSSSSSDLLQLADLLTGSVYGDVHVDTLSSQVKLELLGLLKSKLNVRTLLDKRLGDPNGPFRIFVA